MNFFHAVLIVFCIIAYALVDLVWIGYFMKDYYINWLVHVIRPFAHYNIQHIISVIATWSLIVGAIYYFVMPLVRSQGVWQAFYHGVLFGLIIYGVYETTNYAVIYSWQPLMVIVDSLWGAVICGIITILMQFLLRFS